MKITLDRTHIFYWLAVLGLLFIILLNTRDTRYIDKLEASIASSHKQAKELAYESFGYGYRKCLVDVTTGHYNPKVALDSFKLKLMGQRGNR